MCRGGNRLPPEWPLLCKGRLDACMAVGGSGDSDENEGEVVTTFADNDDRVSDTSSVAAESNEDENGADTMFAESSENDVGEGGRCDRC